MNRIRRHLACLSLLVAATGTVHRRSVSPPHETRAKAAGRRSHRGMAIENWLAGAPEAELASV